MLAVPSLIILLTGSGCIEANLLPEETWAVILEQNFYPHPYTPLDVDYVNSNSLTRTLKTAGLDDDHSLAIHEGVSESRINEAVDWLKEMADGEDAVIF